MTGRDGAQISKLLRKGKKMEINRVKRGKEREISECQNKGYKTRKKTTYTEKQSVREKNEYGKGNARREGNKKRKTRKLEAKAKNRNTWKANKEIEMKRER